MKSNESIEKKEFETKAIRAQLERSDNNEHSVPLYLTSSFVFDTAEEMRAAFNEESDDYIYSRYVNPNTNEFINKVCLLEGAEAGFATASGMAAIYIATAHLVSWLNSLPHASEWIAGQNLVDPTTWNSSALQTLRL